MPRAADIADRQPATGRARYRDIRCWPDMPPFRARVSRAALSGAWLAGEVQLLAGSGLPTTGTRAVMESGIRVMHGEM